MSRNSLAARLCRANARDDAEAAMFLDMLGVLGPDGTVRPDDDTPRRVSDLEPAGGSWAGWDGT